MQEPRTLDAASSALRIRLARDLHDGSAQVLAALDLELAACRELARRGQMSAVQVKLRRISAAMRDEQDRIRTYARELAGEAPRAPRRRSGAARTRVSVNVDCEGSATVIGEVLAIIREALTNVERHAEATSAAIHVRSIAGEIQIAVEDDGIGIGDHQPSWTVASRVRDLAGRYAAGAASPSGGTRLAVVLPTKGLLPRH